MISSMTGFATQTFEQYSWELRSLNHRYLEATFKIPDDCRHLESLLTSKLKTQIKRGKVECTLKRLTQTDAEMTLDKTALSQLVATFEAVAEQSERPITLDGLSILKWPGIIAQRPLQIDDAGIIASFESTLTMFNQSRLREGEATAQGLYDKISELETLLDEIKAMTPNIIASAQNRLADRLAELTLSLDPERLHQEVVLLTSKADVNEELERLTAHIAEVRRCIDIGGAIGRRLDFMMQELNREANTLSAKAIAADSTRGAVELKVLIEQMREQIQNLE